MTIVVKNLTKSTVSNIDGYKDQACVRINCASLEVIPPVKLQFLHAFQTHYTVSVLYRKCTQSEIDHCNDTTQKSNIVCIRKHSQTCAYVPACDTTIQHTQSCNY